MTSSDVEHWQCDKSIRESLEYMLDNQIMCDVTLLLGEERNEVHAHKCILASRSPVFHDMLNGPMTEKGKIEIPDIDDETFQLFLKYLYTDDIILTPEKVISIRHVARRYCVDRLTCECKEFAEEMDYINVFTFLDDAIKFSDEEIAQLCLKKIEKETDLCNESPSFISISKETLKSITELDKISIEEERLYEAMLMWCDAECDRQQLSSTWTEKRKVLGDILYNIRFRAMKSQYFAEHVAPTDLLTADEKVEIFMYYVLERQEDLNYFKKDNREKASPLETEDEDTSPVPNSDSDINSD